MTNNKYTSRDKNRHKANTQLNSIDRAHKGQSYRNAPCHDIFTCKNCNHIVSPEGAATTHRNHCPKCLVSVHLDIIPGDRASLCGAMMDPISVWVRKNGEWAILHRCLSCGEITSNRIAADDNPTLLMSIAVKPLALPPFPLGKLEYAEI